MSGMTLRLGVVLLTNTDQQVIYTRMMSLMMKPDTPVRFMV
jgi:hypothetical protein